MRRPARDLLRSILGLRSTIKSCRARLGERLSERPGAVLARAARGATPSGKVSIYEPVFDHLDTELVAVRGHLSMAENTYADDQFLLAQARRLRDQAADDVRDLHAPLQRLLAAHPQLGGSEIVAETPCEPMRLAQQSKITLSFLREFESRPPTPVRGVTLDAGALAHDLEPAMARLEARLVDVNKSAAGVTLARFEADEAFARAGHVLSRVARTLDSLSELAGDAKLAGRIRRHCG